MWKYDSPASSAWAERRRLIRFRRKKEHLRFSEEFKLVPRGLKLSMAALLVVALAVTLGMCANNFPEPWPIAHDLGMSLALLALAGMVVGSWLLLATIVLLTGYVYRDAQRRGMNAFLWTFLVIVMLPAYVAMGFIFYFIAREPLPYHCPKCGMMVSARFNYCPGCKYVLHPTCPSCQREVGEMDRFCPHCGNDLAPAAVGRLS